ncbi:hypothetical protein H0A71_18185 [Alcaligenaceae bacterium]|nr:hypothetical protein [Alcaligenaceae bacterium]
MMTWMHGNVQQQQDASEHDAWFRRQVQMGIDSANAGNLIPAADVDAKFAAKRAATRRRLDSE